MVIVSILTVLITWPSDARADIPKRCIGSRIGEASAYAPAPSATTVPKLESGCPCPSADIGGGMCASADGTSFVPENGGCPSGSNSAGYGYCSSTTTAYVPASSSGSCPSGTKSAGYGYCRR